MWLTLAHLLAPARAAYGVGPAGSTAPIPGREPAPRGPLPPGDLPDTIEALGLDSVSVASAPTGPIANPAVALFPPAAPQAPAEAPGPIAEGPGDGDLDAVSLTLQTILDDLQAGPRDAAQVDRSLTALARVWGQVNGWTESHASRLQAIRALLVPAVAAGLPAPPLANDGGRSFETRVQWLQRALYLVDLFDGDLGVRDIGNHADLSNYDVDGRFGSHTQATLGDIRGRAGLQAGSYDEPARQALLALLNGEMVLGPAAPAAPASPASPSIPASPSSPSAPPSRSEPLPSNPPASPPAADPLPGEFDAWRGRVTGRWQEFEQHFGRADDERRGAETAADRAARLARVNAARGHLRKADDALIALRREAAALPALRQRAPDGSALAARLDQEAAAVAEQIERAGVRLHVLRTALQRLQTQGDAPRSRETTPAPERQTPRPPAEPRQPANPAPAAPDPLPEAPSQPAAPTPPVPPRDADRTATKDVTEAARLLQAMEADLRHAAAAMRALEGHAKPGTVGRLRDSAQDAGVEELQAAYAPALRVVQAAVQVMALVRKRPDDHVMQVFAARAGDLAELARRDYEGAATGYLASHTGWFDSTAERRQAELDVAWRRRRLQAGG